MQFIYFVFFLRWQPLHRKVTERPQKKLEGIPSKSSNSTDLVLAHTTLCSAITTGRKWIFFCTFKWSLVAESSTKKKNSILSEGAAVILVQYYISLSCGAWIIYTIIIMVMATGPSTLLITMFRFNMYILFFIPFRRRRADRPTSSGKQKNT